MCFVARRVAQRGFITSTSSLACVYFGAIAAFCETLSRSVVAAFAGPSSGGARCAVFWSASNCFAGILTCYLLILVVVLIMMVSGDVVVVVDVDVGGDVDIISLFVVTAVDAIVIVFAVAVAVGFCRWCCCCRFCRCHCLLLF